MMCRRLLFVVLFYLYVTNVSSLICYIGTDQQCMVAPDMSDCGEGELCQCAKYRFQCTKDDQACTEQEQANQVKKWAYTITAASTCQSMQSAPSIYEDLSCCSTNKCNPPASGSCLWSQARRRALRMQT